MMCRRLSEDLDSYTSTILSTDGVVTAVKLFRRQLPLADAPRASGEDV